MEARLQRIKELIIEREKLDAELDGLISGTPPKAVKRACSICHAEGHTARNCPTKEAA